MTIINKASKIAGYKLKKGSYEAYSDASKVSKWAAKSVSRYVSSDLFVHGKKLRPTENITRGETAVAVLTLLQKAELVDVR